MNEHSEMSYEVAQRLLRSALLHRVHNNNLLSEDLEARVKQLRPPMEIGVHYLTIATMYTHQGRRDDAQAMLNMAAEILVPLHPLGTIHFLLGDGSVLWLEENPKGAVHAYHLAGQLIDHIRSRGGHIDDGLVEAYESSLAAALREALRNPTVSALDIVSGLAKI